MKRPDILLPVLALTAVAPAFAQGKESKKPAKGPYNVVFFISDQMSARALPIYNPENTTLRGVPNMERLAREGVMFMNSVCVVPYSSPSRASFVTGLYPQKHEILANVNNGCAPLDPKIFTTEDYLHEHGYATGFFGKWHLGYIKDWACYKETSEDQTVLFDHVYADLRRSKNHVAEPAREGEVLTQPDRDQGYGFYQMKYMYDKTVGAPNDAFRDKLATVGRFGVPVDLDNWTLSNTDGIEFIKANRDRPFMATISLEPPHLPFAVQEPYYSQVTTEDVWFPPSAWDHSPLYKEYPSYKISEYVGEQGVRIRLRSYYAEILYIDDMLGRVLKTLDDLGLADRTLVIFTADHGDPIGSHGMLFDKLINNFPEEMVLTPAFMRLPGVIPAGRRVQATLNTVDFAPTILDYLGKPVPASMQGVSIKPVLDGAKMDEVGFTVSMRPYARMVRGEIDGKLYSYAKVFIVKTNKVVSEELYNITDDPWQVTNQIANPAYRDIKERLIAKYNEYADRNGDRHMEDLPSKGIPTTGNLIPTLIK